MADFDARYQELVNAAGHGGGAHHTAHEDLNGARGHVSAGLALARRVVDEPQRHTQLILTGSLHCTNAAFWDRFEAGVIVSSAMCAAQPGQQLH